MGIRVLVVDDDKDLLTLIKKFMVKEQPDFEIISTISAQDAVRKLEEEHFDTIVCDYYLGVGEMNGLELLEWLRASHSTIPFIMFTGRSREEVAIRALNLGADLYLKKDQEDLGNLFVELVHHIKSSVESVQMEKTLWEERSKFQKYLDVAGVMIVALNSDGRVTLMNRRGCNILGYDLDEIIGKDWFKTCLPKSLQKNAHSVFRNLMKGKTEPVECFENPVLTKNGEERIIAWHNTVLTDESGMITGMLSSGEDITEYKRADEALRQSELRYHDLLMALPGGIGITDLDENFTYVNQSFSDMLGYSVEELVQKNVLDLTPVDDHRKVKAETERRKRYFSSTYELQMISKEGELKLFEVSTLPQKNNEGNVIGTIGVVSDITERKRTEEALRESEERYRTIVQSMSDIIFVHDKDDYFAQIYVSNEESLISSIEGFIGHHPSENLPPYLSQLYLEASAKVRATGITEEYDYPLTVRGKDKWFASLLTLHEDGESIIVTTREITEKKRAEVALHESEERYRGIFESASVGLARTRIDDGRLLFCNSALARMIGYETPEKAIDDYVTAEHFVDPEFRQRGLKELWKIGEAREFLAEMTKRDGTRMWVEFSSILNKKERFTDDVIVEVTDRKRAEDALRESEQRNKMIVDAMSDLVLVHDSEGRYSDCFSQDDSLLVRPWNEMKGRKPEEVVPPDLAAQHNECVKKVRETGETMSFEYELETGGALRWFQGTLMLHEDEEHIVVAVKDITERKLAEVNLRQSEEKYRSIFDLTPVGLAFQEIVVDERGKPTDFIFIDVNEGFEALTGLRKDDIVGKSASHMLTSGGELGLEWIDVFGKVALTGSRARFDQYSEALGRWFSVTAYSPEKNFFITAYTDVTEQKKGYEILKQQKKELSDFAHMMSHDLNSYFFKIKGSILLLGSKDEFPEIRGIKLLTEEMIDLVQHSVALADAGIVIDKKYKVNLDHLVRDIAVHHLPEGIALVQGPLQSVMADEIKLIQIFQNLFDNAVEHGSPTTVEVQRYDSKEGVRIVVINDGKPIPTDLRPKIFQRGFTTGDKRKGYGLSIIKKLVEAHDWQIQLADTPETAFEILIPNAAG